ncbi:MAG TPA: cupredoxin domain-containing protein [Chloroflexota bacterium]|nr:cupredoxin domain-containing protein [Chloroflexota bacterium]
MRAPLLAGALLAVATAAGCAPAGAASQGVAIVFRYSRFAPGAVTVPAGVPVTVTLRNDDPIEHEWIVGPPEVHAAHRVGTEPFHAERPTEVTVPALSTRQTRVTWDRPGEYAFICHLPGHEDYGMRGTVRVVAR